MYCNVYNVLKCKIYSPVSVVKNVIWMKSQFRDVIINDIHLKNIKLKVCFIRNTRIHCFSDRLVGVVHCLDPDQLGLKKLERDCLNMIDLSSWHTN